jgi:hypothetical protein
MNVEASNYRTGAYFPRFASLKLGSDKDSAVYDKWMVVREASMHTNVMSLHFAPS